MSNHAPASFSDAALLVETVRVASVERQCTSQLIALLAEVDARKLYLGQGYSSLFVWCTQVLHLSESSAYGRITAARAARRFPVILKFHHVVPFARGGRTIVENIQLRCRAHNVYDAEVTLGLSGGGRMTRRRRTLSGQSMAPFGLSCADG